MIARMGFAVVWWAFLPFLWPCILWTSLVPIPTVAVALAAVIGLDLANPTPLRIRALLLVSRWVVQQGPSTSDSSFLPPD